ncbi:hypothetical protein [Chryseobacterium salviniae]|uniref:Uncharacterized protein n=1 Tax=Chryseobacterium salviniae TaxID=3101750 RepID=A0ABU6HNK6_9FLAO|nr:hypothetical protein [Chryseobacterium sp. T9W2-O]MEC3874543.1 hypothetical protein [Chryseobacterium sp. T9W2-O]
MDAGVKQINQEKRGNVLSKDKAESQKKTKPEISNSFFQRIISLLKKEELI